MELVVKYLKTFTKKQMANIEVCVTTDKIIVYEKFGKEIFYMPLNNHEMLCGVFSANVFMQYIESSKLGISTTMLSENDDVTLDVTDLDMEVQPFVFNNNLILNNTIDSNNERFYKVVIGPTYAFTSDSHRLAWQGDLSEGAYEVNIRLDFLQRIKKLVNSFYSKNATLKKDKEAILLHKKSVLFTCHDYHQHIDMLVYQCGPAKIFTKPSQGGITLQLIKSFVNTKSESYLKVNKKQFLDTLKQVSKLKDFILFDLWKDNVTLNVFENECRYADKQQIAFTADIQTDNIKAINFNLDIKYLIDAVNTIEGKEVTLKFSESLSPIFVCGDSDIQVLIMPRRLLD